MSISNIVKEGQIDQIIESLAEVEQVEEMMLSLAEEAPAYMAYVFSEDTKMLAANEQDILTFIVAGLWKCTGLGVWKDPELSEESISNLEEKNWELLQEGKGEFRTRLDAFYKDFAQEDMLAFVEDMLMDEDAEFSKEGQEHVFAISKTFLDILLA